MLSDARALIGNVSSVRNPSEQSEIRIMNNRNTFHTDCLREFAVYSLKLLFEYDIIY